MSGHGMVEVQSFYIVFERNISKKKFWNIPLDFYIQICLCLTFTKIKH